MDVIITEEDRNNLRIMNFINVNQKILIYELFRINEKIERLEKFINEDLERHKNYKNKLELYLGLYKEEEAIIDSNELNRNYIK